MDYWKNIMYVLGKNFNGENNIFKSLFGVILFCRDFS